MPQTKPITNISTYKFAPMSGLKELRERLLSLCKELNLKGTILLSTEGVNLFIAGPGEAVDTLVAELRSLPGLEDLTPKVSLSEEQPFRRMLVRIKKEIIAFGVDGIDPSKYTSRHLPPQELKKWLDEGREVLLFDTRNDYEVKMGTFKGAVPAQVDHFRDFPAAVAKLPEEWKKKPIVTFCTGGIRCEKAAPFMEREGFEQIWQLDGGILKYFEECGPAHYDGECFVFDQRVGVDPALEETPSAQCFACQTPLTAEEQADPRYVAHVSCPFCFRTDEEQREKRRAETEAAIRRAAQPLPGSVPYDHVRPFHIPAACDGMMVLDAICHILPHTDREEWLRVFAAGRITTKEGEQAAPDHRVRAGEHYRHLKPASQEPAVNAEVKVLFEDEALLVLHKPAPLPIHEGGRFCRNTLQYFINTALHPLMPRSIHRLDANTTGVVVFAKTRHFARLVQPQFERGEVEKVYLARVQGHPQADAFACDAPVSAEAGKLGGREICDDGQEAHTHFRVLRRDADGTTLLEARPLTGRTNQIRLHLRHLGHPIQGDATYPAEGGTGDTQTLPVDAPPLCLHAWKLTLKHPLNAQTMTFEAARPSWA
jgi:RluA family pseudouridine synthase